MTDRKIGYIGLGNMGGGMASHLVASGYDVTVYDVRAEAVQALVDKGATAASSPREVAEQCDVIVSSLPTPQSVENAATGENGIVQGLSAGKVYIDMSSIDPDTTRRVGAAVREKGAEMLDVPVGMGPAQAATGMLTLMIGGNASVVEDCKDVLDTLGDQQFYCGELGLGVTTKIVNNLVSCSVATLLGEAVTMGVAAGLDPERLREVMNNTAAQHAARTLGPEGQGVRAQLRAWLQARAVAQGPGTCGAVSGITGSGEYGRVCCLPGTDACDGQGPGQRRPVCGN